MQVDVRGRDGRPARPGARGAAKTQTAHHNQVRIGWMHGDDRQIPSVSGLNTADGQRGPCRAAVVAVRHTRLAKRIHDRVELSPTDHHPVRIGRIDRKRRLVGRIANDVAPSLVDVDLNADESVPHPRAAVLNTRGLPCRRGREGYPGVRRRPFVVDVLHRPINPLSVSVLARRGDCDRRHKYHDNGRPHRCRKSALGWQT